MKTITNTMNSVVLLSFVAVAVNFVSGTTGEQNSFLVLRWSITNWSMCILIFCCNICFCTIISKRLGTVDYKEIGTVKVTKRCVHDLNEFPATGGDRVLDAIGRQLSDIIKSRIRGDARIGEPTLPTIDEIHFENQHVDLCGLILCFTANLTKGTLNGLNGVEVPKFDFNSDGTRVTIDIDIFIPKLQLVAEHYEMRGNIMQALPLAGEGRLYFETTGIMVWTTIVLQVTDQTSIESFEKSGFNISSIISRTEFDGNIDGIFNAMVEELMAERLTRFNKAIAAHCGGILKELINPILN